MSGELLPTTSKRTSAKSKPWIRAKSAGKTARSSSWTGALTSNVIRLFVYYLIYLSIWKCPPGAELSEESPCLCSPLHKTFDLVSPHVSPIHEKFAEYAHPYVDSAKPYVEKVRPYVQKGVDSGVGAYNAYVQPPVSKAAAKAHSVVIAPYQEKVFELHDKHVQPLVNRAHQFHADKVAPLIEQSYKGSKNVYSSYVIPTYEKVHPHVSKAHGAVKEHVWPRLSDAHGKFSELVILYFELVKNWFADAVQPKVKSVYQDAVEPQINKIYDRVAPNRGDSESDETVVAETTEITASASAAGSTAVNSETGSGVVRQKLESLAAVINDGAAAASEAVAAGIGAATANVAGVVSADDTASAGSSARKASEKHKKIVSISEELAKWKEIVDKTSLEAFATFLDDIEQEKHVLVEEARGEFTTLLQKLSQYENEAYKELSALVQRIDDEQEEGQAVDEEVSTGLVQSEFRRHADLIRTGAMAVRERSEKLAADVLQKTEEVRSITVDILDEFAEVTLHELGRKMVSINSLSATQSTSSAQDSDSIPNWKDWKEFRSLKDRLYSSRQDIVDHEVNMADVNKMLREAQETANLLAKESAQLLSGLRSKADFGFQQRLSRRAESDEQLDFDETPVDAEIYDELEEDEEPTTITQTIYETYTQVTSELLPESTERSEIEPTDISGVEEVVEPTEISDLEEIVEATETEDAAEPEETAEAADEVANEASDEATNETADDAEVSEQAVQPVLVNAPELDNVETKKEPVHDDL
ncbi:hypothetical protein AWJ20_2357 [Sugiyamaella lignohabitans]|uniref:Uncharacterized protein n=1 Tax=Sugiyamaella lignohabitans TaxID=796027 RepID=A0A161HGB5_9ASCO|nr:uncharacterized protein AWJ20_2357 [Sugiyamaella lignohabitans]ANB14750.1 hypothetical protein AWJ20_2357 [Sugiyamaella lignohabitans]